MSYPETRYLDIRDRDRVVKLLKECNQQLLLEIESSIVPEQIYAIPMMYALTLIMIKRVTKEQGRRVSFNKISTEEPLKRIIGWADKDVEVACLVAQYLGLVALKVQPEGMKEIGHELKRIWQNMFPETESKSDDSSEITGTTSKRISRIRI